MSCDSQRHTARLPVSPSASAMEPRGRGWQSSLDAATRVGVSGENRNRGGLSVRTLAIASAASALATYLVPMIWRPGTIPAAAATPVIVALISEALSRPAEHVSQAGRLVRVPRSRFGRPELGPVARRRLRLAVVTGLLAFLVAAVVITVTELATGEAVSTDQRTTLLGGSVEPSEDEPDPAPGSAPDSETPAAPAAPEATATPAETVTPEAPTPGETPTPAPVAPEATPVPAPTTAPNPAPAPTTP